MAVAGVRRAATGGVAVLVAIALAAPAHAAPRAADPPAPGDPVVLIVHAAGDAADVRATAADAASSTVDVRHTFPADHAFSVEVPAGQQAAAAATLRATPGVTGIEAPVHRSFSAVPDDPQYAAEKTYLASVDAPAAWEVTHGSRNVRIAVVDSGVDVSHPDLAGKLVGTYDAHTGGTSVTDDVGHGTFVAGVAAAATNNHTGIAGAGYDTSLLGVKIAGTDGDLSIDDEIAGINWAVSNHADIINLSLGGTDFSATEQTAIEHAIAQGVLVVAAAGNDGTSVKQYPAAYPGVVSVGAVDTATRKRADFSSYGSWVTLAAPGVAIRSTTPLQGSEFFATRSGYASADGTSFSAPLVAGAAALLKATDPKLTVPQLRHALTASAGGFAQQGLGTGQVDFARALQHLPPAAAPTSVTVDGRADELTLTATTSAPTVEFRLDSGAWTAPIIAVGGSASTDFASWGYAEGPHTVHVRACSRYGECGTGERTASVDLANTAPLVSAPAAGGAASGPFTVTASHPSGGGARLLIDNAPAGFQASSPYTFAVDGSRLADGEHTVQTVLCSASGTLCEGPGSVPFTITVRSLHPTITALSAPAISPNGDRSGDTAALHFTLPDRESVTVRTVDAQGRVVGSDALGTLGRGAHTWTWRGLGARRARLPDGRYTLAVVTRTPAGTTPELNGYAATTGTVDTVAPHLSNLTGAATTFYPVHDGYRDTFAPGVTVSAAGTLVLTVRSSRGAVVRTLSAHRNAGRTTIVWSGRDRHGRLVAAGRYRWQYAITDAAGNRRLSAHHSVTVSRKRLVSRVGYVLHRASTYRAAGGTDTCSTAVSRTSSYAHGLALRNACPAASGDFAYASYRFVAPRAVRYSRVTFQVYGRSTHRPSELSVALDRVDGGVEIPAYVKITRPGGHWYSIASVPAAGHISGAHAAYASVLLTGRYAGVNDFDLQFARIRVSYTTLA